MNLRDFCIRVSERLVKLRCRLIDSKNRRRLVNHSPTLIVSDCTGGYLYKWLGLKFMSPFINLYMDNEDFITALENFDEFIAGEITEDKTVMLPPASYPIGRGVHGEKIHFMHYENFADAKSKWDERKKRIDRSNIGVILANWGQGCTDDVQKREIARRFQKLDFRNKIILSGEDTGITEAFQLKGFDSKRNINICYCDKYGRRFIDAFDYVGFINSFTVRE